MNSDSNMLDCGQESMRVLTGLAASRGFVAGPVYLFRSAGADQIPEYQVDADQIPNEIVRLTDAFAITRNQIRSLSAELIERISGNEATIFDGHLMMLDDPTFFGACKERVAKEYLNAEAAVNAVGEKYASIFAAMDDAYLKERSKDVGDIAKRIIRNLQGGADAQPIRVEQPCIIVAEELTPSETISSASRRTGAV